MGQQCCAASQNTPEIIITADETDSKTKANQQEKGMKDSKVKETMEKSQKNDFYGKDGHVYSKTITKEMTSSIDHNLDEYKKIIFNKQETITQLPEEESALEVPKQREKREDRIERQKNIVG